MNGERCRVYDVHSSYENSGEGSATHPSTTFIRYLLVVRGDDPGRSQDRFAQPAHAAQEQESDRELYRPEWYAGQRLTEGGDDARSQDSVGR